MIPVLVAFFPALVAAAIFAGTLRHPRASAPRVSVHPYVLLTGTPRPPSVGDRRY